jgi:anti-sigma B factor antagonist
VAQNSNDIKSTLINTAKVGASTVLTPRDSLIENNCEALENLFNELLTQQKTDIILDCKAVSFLDSKALELLLQMHEELKDRGGTLKIVGTNAVCQDILFATRLVNVLHIYQDIHKAVVSRT